MQPFSPDIQVFHVDGSHSVNPGPGTAEGSAQNEQDDSQASEQDDHQPSKQDDDQVSEQVDHQPSEQDDLQPLEQNHYQPLKHSGYSSQPSLESGEEELSGFVTHKQFE